MWSQTSKGQIISKQPELRQNAKDAETREVKFIKKKFNCNFQIISKYYNIIT